MYDYRCDHDWTRDDQHCEICVHCHKRREIGQ